MIQIATIGKIASVDLSSYGQTMSGISAGCHPPSTATLARTTPALRTSGRRCFPKMPPIIRQTASSATCSGFALIRSGENEPIVRWASARVADPHLVGEQVSAPLGYPM
jgi:hypothetical protein